MVKKEKIIKRFDALADKRQYWKDRNRYYYSDQEKYFRFLVPEKLSILELGCGTGLYTGKLKDNAYHVIATDFSEEMIEIAKKKRGDLENVQFAKADALELDFEEASFDTIFMANLIHIIGNAEGVIKECYRVLKRGGKIIITSFAIDEMSFFHKFSIAIRYIIAFGKPSKEAAKEKTTKKNVEAILRNNGFEIAKSEILGEKSKAIYIVGIKNKIL